MSTPPFDPRSICNLMLDEAERQGIPVSNLALQKLLYFAHGLFLIEMKQPLVSGYFEAWEYGPVHPAAYQAFKVSGNRPITIRAEKQDPLTGHFSPLPKPQNPSLNRLISQVMSSFGRMTVGRLVEISHAKGAPWDVVVQDGKSNMAFGLRIGDNLIQERFKFHKVSVGNTPATGEPNEDAPFAGYRSG